MGDMIRFQSWSPVLLAAIAALAACSSSSSPTVHPADGGTVVGGDDAGADGAADGGPRTSGNPTGLWIDGLFAYPVTGLADGGAPELEDTCPDVGNSAASTPMAFDGAGNLWVQDAGDGSISVVMWSAAELAAACSSGKPARTIEVTPAGQTAFEISSMAFDAQGTLWVAMPDGAILLGLTAAQIAATGTVVPKYAITSYPTNTAAELYAPQGIAFDASGNLWVANDYSVLEYKAATLAGALAARDGGAQGPNSDAYLSTTAGEAATTNLGASGPTGTGWPTFDNVSFDKAGNLWVVGSTNTGATSASYVSEFAKAGLSALSATSTPSPMLTLSQPAAEASMGVTYLAIAFDAAGNVWLGAGTDVYRFPPAGLPSGAYDVDIANVPFLAKSLGFNPIPAGLPIQP